MLWLTASLLSYEMMTEKVHGVEFLRQLNEQRHGHQLQLGYNVQHLVRVPRQAKRHATNDASFADSREAETVQLLQTAICEHLHSRQLSKHRSIGVGRRQLQELHQHVKARGKEEWLAFRLLGERVQEQDCE